jgi:hypothetical protein
LCTVVDSVDHDIEYTGVHDDDDADPRQMVQGEPSSELVDNADEQIVQCLQHVRQHDFVLVIFESSVVMLLLCVVHALDLSKVHVCRKEVEVVERMRVVELEADNMKLLTELMEARLVLAEADAARSSLDASQEEVEKECAEMCATVDVNL